MNRVQVSRTHIAYNRFPAWYRRFLITYPLDEQCLPHNDLRVVGVLVSLQLSFLGQGLAFFGITTTVISSSKCFTRQRSRSHLPTQPLCAPQISRATVFVGRDPPSPCLFSLRLNPPLPSFDFDSRHAALCFHHRSLLPLRFLLVFSRSSPLDLD